MWYQVSITEDAGNVYVMADSWDSARQKVTKILSGKNLSVSGQPSQVSDEKIQYLLSIEDVDPVGNISGDTMYGDFDFMSEY